MGQQCNGNCNQGRSCNCDPLAPARGIVNGLLIVAPFWLCVIALVLMAGCTVIGHKPPPEDWPKLQVTVRDVGFWEGNAICGNGGLMPLVWQYAACAIVYFESMTCYIYLMVTGESRELALEHERDHCAGKDHIGSTLFADAWADFKRNQRSAK